MSAIDKKTLEHLAKLARIKLDTKEEEKLLHDLQSILKHFEELESLDTTQVSPMAGGTRLVNAFRSDEGSANTNQGAGTELFPEKEGSLLKIPPVFE